MRGSFFGRNRADKPQPTVNVISSYTEAVYPRRPYRFYHQVASVPASELPSANAHIDRGTAASVTTTVVIPSINADVVCEPHVRNTASPLHVSQEIQQETKKLSPPLLRSHADCFVPDESGVENASFTQCRRYAEPLNLFHYYSDLVSLSGRDDGAECASRRQGTAESGNGGDHTKLARLTELANAIGLPQELRTFTVARGPHNVVSSLHQLRIRTAKRPRLAQPLRRGSKVVTMPSSAPPARDAADRGAVHSSTTGTRRPLGVVAASRAPMQDHLTRTDKTTLKRGRAELSDSSGAASGCGEGNDIEQPGDVRGAPRRRRLGEAHEDNVKSCSDVKMDLEEGEHDMDMRDGGLVAADVSMTYARVRVASGASKSEPGEEEDDANDELDEDNNDSSSLDMSVDADDDDKIDDFDDGSDGRDEYM